MRTHYALPLLMAMGLMAPAPAQPPAAAPPAAPAQAAPEGGLASLLAKYPVKFGGFIKLDASWDDSRLSDGNYARWVLSEGANEDDPQFNMTARQSRFWLELKGPEAPGLKTTGYVELDFYEGTAENKNVPMLRKCYLKVHWAESDFAILAGQDSDLISRLVAPTINYTVGWWVGDIGYRRPQLTFSKGFTLDDARLLAELAAVRTIGDASGAASTAPFTPGDTGEDAGFPTVEARLGLTLPLLHEKKKATLALFGHWGQEEYDTNTQGKNETFETWSAGIEADLPVCDMLTFQLNLWTGANLDAFLGGVGQGINAARIEEIKSTGGWAALVAGPFSDFTLTGGAGMDDPDEDDLAAGGQSKNLFVFGNAWYAINQAVKAGLELSYWKTEYKGADDGDAFRAQFSMMFNF